jgi:hypothetical protein
MSRDVPTIYYLSPIQSYPIRNIIVVELQGVNTFDAAATGAKVLSDAPYLPSHEPSAQP